MTEKQLKEGNKLSALIRSINNKKDWGIDGIKRHLFDDNEIKFDKDDDMHILTQSEIEQITSGIKNVINPILDAKIVELQKQFEAI